MVLRPVRHLLPMCQYSWSCMATMLPTHKQSKFSSTIAIYYCFVSETEKKLYFMHQRCSSRSAYCSTQITSALQLTQARPITPCTFLVHMLLEDGPWASWASPWIRQCNHVSLSRATTAVSLTYCATVVQDLGSGLETQSLGSRSVFVILLPERKSDHLSAKPSKGVHNRTIIVLYVEFEKSSHIILPPPSFSFKFLFLLCDLSPALASPLSHSPHHLSPSGQSTPLSICPLQSSSPLSVKAHSTSLLFNRH